MSPRVASLPVLCCVWVALGAGCHRESQDDARRRAGPSAFERLASVDARDGIDAQEAGVIAAVYLEARVAETGWTDPPIRRADAWEAVVHLGMKGSRLEHPIVVDARTGAVSLEGHPRIESVEALRAAVPSPSRKAGT